MRQHGSRWKRVLPWSVGYLAFLLVLWPVSALWAESVWLTMALAYLPQLVFLVPLVLLLGWGLVKRDRWAIAANLFSAVLVVFGLAGLRLRPVQPVGPIRVVTYNIQHAVRGIDEVSRIIASLNPDILFLQESGVTDDATKIPPSLRRALEGYELITGGGMLIASRFKPVDRVVHTLLAERGKSMQEMTVSVDGRLVKLFNLHLQPVHALQMIGKGVLGIPGHLTQVARERRLQVERARAVIDSWDGAAIVAGDMNGPARGPVYRRLAGDLVDAHKAVGAGFGYTIPSHAPMWRMDYVLCRGLTVRTCEVPVTEASDHRPVLVTLGG